VLLTDRAFAGSDTLATSYALTLAIRRLEPDLVLGGRQAIDGDTAQVGPQIAEKLGWPQVTYAEEMHFENDRLVVRRRLERGVETVSAPAAAGGDRQRYRPRMPVPQRPPGDEVQICPHRH